MGPMGSGGMPQSPGAVSGRGMGGSAGPVQALSVTQDRTTPHESPRCFLVHPEFSLPGPSWQHRPSPAPCRRCQLCLMWLLALLRWHRLPSARACVPPVLWVSGCPSGTQIPKGFQAAGLDPVGGEPGACKDTAGTAQPLAPGQNGAKQGFDARWASSQAGGPSPGAWTEPGCAWALCTLIRG